MDAALNEPVTRASKKGIFGWMMFDWAQQPFHTLIITFIFAPYFTSTVAKNAVEGQELWGLATGIGSLFIALLAPFIGAVADASGPRKPWIFLFSIIGVVGCWMLWFAEPASANIPMVIVGIILALIGMEFAAVFNNGMMPSLVPRSELGKLSGSAWAIGYVGGLFTLILMLALMIASPESGKTIIGFDPSVFGFDVLAREGDRAAGPITAIWYIVFIIPLFLFTPDIRTKVTSGGALKNGMRELTKTLKSLTSQRSYFSYLMSSMFYRDALNGLYMFGGIYAAGVLGWSITQIGIFGIIAAATGAIGAWMGGRMDQKFGPKPVVYTCITLLIFSCILIVSTTPTEVLFMSVSQEGLPDIVFYIAGSVIGAAGGSLQAASRTLLVDQVPREKVTEAFGLYALSGRATSFIAPLTIAWATSVTESQRLGITPVIVLFIVGFLLLPLVSSAYDSRK